MKPPTEAMASLISVAVRRAVPLKAICPRTGAMPLSSIRSWRLPALTTTDTDAVSMCGITSVATVRPDSRRVTVGIFLPLFFRARRYAEASAGGESIGLGPADGHVEVGDQAVRQRIDPAVDGERLAPRPGVLD